MTSPLVIDSTTVERTVAVGAAVARTCRPGDVIALVGELGAGKTQFVRGMAGALGITESHVSSPTFVIAHEYESADGGSVLVHVDAYRLGGRDDLVALGFASDEGGDLAAGAVMAIEWADRVAEVLPPDHLEVRIEHAEDGRRLTLMPHGRWAARMIDLNQRLADTVR